MPKYKKFSTRADMSFKPSTLNEQARTVDFVLSTDQPVEVVDWERWEYIDEILVPSGVIIPRNKQIPLLDTHSRNSVHNILGSVRNIRVEDAGVVGTLYFANDPEAQSAFEKIRDGHLTDGSVGYRLQGSKNLKKDESEVINGKEYTGEARLVTKWRLFEFSLAPVGADDLAKARADEINTVQNLPAHEERTTNTQEDNEVSKETKTTETQPVDALRAEQEQALKAEREATRAMLSTIRTEARALKLTDDETDKVLESENLESARAQMIEIVSKRTTPITTNKVEITADEADKFRAAAVDGILLRAGARIAKPAAGASAIRYGFKGLARECLERSGINTRGMSDEKILQLAIAQRDFPTMSTSTFSYILQDAAEKSVMNGFNSMPTTYEQWCKIGSVSDFKTANRARLSDAPELESINELGELPTKAFADAGATVSADTKGVIINISRKALVNDDLSVLNDIPMAIGGRAAQQVNAYAFTLLANNKLSDGSTAIFSSSHGNLRSAAAAPSATTLKDVRKAMMSQTDIMDTKLNISPAFILVGPENYDALLIILGSEYMKGSTDAGNRNPYFNMATPIVDANIGDAAWYAVANPIFPTVEIVFLNGQRTPVIEELPQNEVLGVRMRAVLDFGGSVLDYRGLYKVPAS